MPDVCIVPTCPDVAGLRGLCRGCLEWVRRRVAAGRATWDMLERAGSCRPITTQPITPEQIDARSAAREAWFFGSLPRPRPDHADRY